MELKDYRQSQAWRASIIDKFAITLNGEVHRTIENGNLIFRIIFRSSKDGAQVTTPSIAACIPLETLPDAKDIVTLERIYAANFFELLRAALEHEARLHLGDVINYGFAEIKGGMDVSEAVEHHLLHTADRLNTWFKVEHEKHREKRREGRGHKSEWTPLELSLAISKAMQNIEHKRDLNYKKVAEMLQKRYGSKAPPTADALKKLVGRHKVDWKAIKSDSEKRFNVTTK